MSKVNLLKIMFPTVFGFPRPTFQLNEVREMISILQNNELIIKDKKLNVSFDVSDEINHQDYMKKYYQSILDEKKTDEKIKIDVNAKIYD